MKGVTKDDSNNYICHDCGATWNGKDRWLLFPVKLKLSRLFGFGVHGVETEPDGAGRRVFKTILSVGWLRIVLGDGYKSKVKWSVKHQGWVNRKQFDYLKTENKIDSFLEEIASK